MRFPPTRLLLAALAASLWLVVAQAQSIKVLVQASPLAGFQYYAGEDLWAQMKEGDRLTLVREPDNEHDARAVRVDWQGHKLGYLPRLENGAVAAEMDRGARVEGRIARLYVHRNPWRRLRVAVYVVL